MPGSLSAKETSMQVRIKQRRSGDDIATFDVTSATGSPIERMTKLKEKLQKVYPPKQFKIIFTL